MDFSLARMPQLVPALRALRTDVASSAVRVTMMLTLGCCEGLVCWECAGGAAEMMVLTMSPSARMAVFRFGISILLPVRRVSACLQKTQGGCCGGGLRRVGRGLRRCGRRRARGWCTRVL